MGLGVASRSQLYELDFRNTTYFVENFTSFLHLYIFLDLIFPGPWAGCLARYLFQTTVTIKIISDDLKGILGLMPIASNIHQADYVAFYPG